MANKDERVLKPSDVLPGVLFGTVIVVTVGLIGNAMIKKK